MAAVQARRPGRTSGGGRLAEGNGGSRPRARRLPRHRHGQHAHRPLRARRHRDRGRRGRDDPQRRLPAGDHAHARLQGGPVLGVQVLPARRRGRPRPLLDVRAARLRGGRGLDAAVPRPPLLRPRDRADQLRRGDHSTAARRRDTVATHASRRSSRSPRTSGSCALRPGRSRSSSSPASTSTSRSPATGRAPLVLDGEHRTPGRARVHDQALPGRALLGPARRRLDQARRRARGHRALRRLHAARQLPAAAAVHRRRRRHGADPVAAALAAGERAASARRSTTTAPAPRPTCSTSTSSPALPCALRPGALGGQQRLDGRDRPDHRRGRPPGGRRRRGRRLRLRPAADGRGRHRPARGQGRARAHIYFDKFTTTADD